MPISKVDRNERMNRLLVRIEENHRQLAKLGSPALFVNSRWRSDVQKASAIRKLEELVDDIWEFEHFRKQSLQESGEAAWVADSSHGSYYHREVQKDLPELERAYRVIAPEAYTVSFVLWQELGSYRTRADRGLVYKTVAAAIGRWEEGSPESAEGYDLAGAWRVIESPLLAFEPDEWLRNAELIRPVLTTALELPTQVKHRLIEVFRAACFGQWLCVTAMSRSVLEYALHELIARKAALPDEKLELGESIAVAGQWIGNVQDRMIEVQRLARPVLHPQRQEGNEQALFQRRDSALKALDALVVVLSAIYTES